MLSIDAITDFFYPNRCPCCNGYIPYDEYICGECLEVITKECSIEGICKYCGFRECKCGHGILYDRVFSCYTYDGLARDGALSLKRSKNLNFAYHVGKILSDQIRDKVIRYDVIVPVPMHRKNRIVRGYNQTEVISKTIAKGLGISIDTHALNVEYSKVAQHSLSKGERFEHASSIYSKGVSDVKDKYIVLVDDIMTTGSTVNVCSNILHGMGAKSVVVAVATVAQLMPKHREQDSVQIK